MPHKIRRSWLALVGLIPCLAAFGAAAVHSPPPAQLPGKEIPPLAFDQYGVSYGLVGPQPVIEAAFQFRNLGLQPITIERVTPSCGCLRWHLEGNRQTYRPGEPGCLTVRMFTANERPGPRRYELEVVTGGPHPQRERLTFRVTLPERKVTVAPAEVFFYQLNGEPATQTVYVTDHRGQRADPLQVTSAECSSKSVTVQILPHERGDDGLPRVPIRLTAAGDVPAGRDLSWLKLTTDDPDFPVIAVPVLVEGPAEDSTHRTVYGPPIPESAAIDVFAVLELQRGGSATPGEF